MASSKNSLSKSAISNHDDDFRAFSDSIDFFRKRDRVRPVDLKEASSARCLSWNCEGRMLAVGCENKAVYVGAFDDHYCRIKSVYVGYGEGQIESLEFSHKNPRLFATCSSDKTVRIWDTSVSKTHRRIETKEQNFYVTWSPDDIHVVCVGKSGSSCLVSAIDSRNDDINYKAVFKEDIFEIVFHPSGKYLFLTANGGKLIILKFPSMQRHATLQVHPPLAECQSIALSPDGQTLAIGGSDATCSIWSLDSMMCTKMIDRLDYPVQAISFSKCSNILALGSEDAFIDVGWVKGGNEKVIDVPVQSQCYDVAWNPKYYLLAYATAAGERDRDTVRLFGCPGESRRT